MRAHEGSCFCGAVALTAAGEPVAAFCHCALERSRPAPGNALGLRNSEAVTMTNGGGSIGVHYTTEKSYRKHCTIGRGHLLTDYPPD